MTWNEGAAAGGTPVIDYRIWYDQGINTYAVLAIGVLTEYYTTTSLQTGTVYKFKVEARNAFGYSSPSDVITIKQAETPSQPATPTTAITGVDRDEITVTWTPPSAQGSIITSYTIDFYTVNGVSSYGIADCDGSESSIISSSTCTVSIYTLMGEPWNLPYGSSVLVRVLATNAYGNSPYSDDGNGAVILKLPDAPVNFIENDAVSTATIIGVSWSEGADDGGAPILDYQLWYDPGTGTSVILASGITNLFYTESGLTEGTTYTFKVRARNVFDFSPFSPEISILAADIPYATDPPTTTI